MTVSVSEINIFPIKSCKGFSLPRSTTTLRGFALDRQWLVTNEEGQFLTQRQLPFMSQISPRIILDANDSPHVTMEITAPNMPPLSVQSAGTGTKREVVVWRDTCEAVDEGAEAAAWFSDYLKTKCRLVRFGQDFVRHVDPKFKKGENDQVGFADGFPFLLISEASLADLNERLTKTATENFPEKLPPQLVDQLRQQPPLKLPMNRFRPNIVVKGCQPFAEDNWKTIKIGGDLVFHVVKPCARCIITCTDQQTAKVGVEPLRTLATFRNELNKILFGQNLVSEGSGVVKVGDELEVLS